MNFKQLVISFGIGLVLTIGSVFIPGSYQGETGNLCQKTESNPLGLCVEELPTGGFPFPFLLDAGGVSVQHKLGAEDHFKPAAFVGNLIIYTAICGFTLALFRRKTHSS